MGWLKQADPELHAWLRRLTTESGNYANMLLSALQTTAEQESRKSFWDNFDTEGRSSGSPWKQLAERTVRERTAAGYGPRHPMLVRSGALKGAVLSAQVEKTAEGVSFSAGSQGYKLKAEYGRNPLTVGDEQMRKIADEMGGRVERFAKNVQLSGAGVPAKLVRT